MTELKHRDPSLYNVDLAPIAPQNRKWGRFEIFNVWACDIQSLFGYTLIAGFFLSSGLNGFAVFAALVMAGLIIQLMVNLIARPCVRYGISINVMARSSMGVRGANLAAVIRGIVAIFRYGAQTYFASSAVALILFSLIGGGKDDGIIFLGLNGISWLSFLLVWVLQVWLFLPGIERVTRFVNFAGTFVYSGLLILAAIICYKAGPAFYSDFSAIFQGSGIFPAGSVAAFLGVAGAMIAYFSVVINFTDYNRFVTNEAAMKKGNFWGLPVNIALFSAIVLVITSGTVSVFGQSLTDPVDIFGRAGSVPLTILVSLMFLAATLGINLVTNFIPPAHDLANLAPEKISLRKAAIIISLCALVIGGLFVAVISQIGLFGIINSLAAALAPIYGIMVADYHVLKKQQVDVDELFNASDDGKYYYKDGWNMNAILAFSVAGIFSIATVWLSFSVVLESFAWLIGAALGAGIYLFISRIRPR